MRIFRGLLFSLLFLLSAALHGNAQDSLAQPARPLAPDSAALASRAASRFDLFLKKHPQLRPTSTVFAIEAPRPDRDRTADFYLLLTLCLLLGAIRVSHPRYFGGLWRNFFGPDSGGRALREWPASAALANLLMNIFFACSAGAYLYCLVRLYTPEGPQKLPPSLLLLGLILCVLAVYGVKWVVARASGWAFGVQAATEQYLFNVFLMNKIIGVALLPFVVMLAFAHPAWVHPLVVVSGIIVAGLVLVRYSRSWPVLRGLFYNSKFHFLAYLCASEILPLAVLTKLLVRWLLR